MEQVMDIVLKIVSGIFSPPWWGYVLVTFLYTHFTIAAVTIFLHRFATHRALELHRVVQYGFRIWLWLTTGMFTKTWVSIHRKHHAKCETKDDPHSPQVMGLRKVLTEGAELYRLAGKDKDMLERHGTLTPDDRLERYLLGKRDRIGVGTMLVVNVILFGPIGITIWAIQMAWIPFTAAGLINGVGHYYGYRNTETEDASRNISPWGILIGGEELHNNHHAYPQSAKLSLKWYEFDIGWMYIRILETLGLARVKYAYGRTR